MIFDLDDDRCLDPGRAGAKAAWLSQGRRVGLPILPGLVVSADESKPYLQAGATALNDRGSGGARLVVSQSELPANLQDQLEEMSAHLHVPLIVRSSSILEGLGEWSGAFTSYLEVTRAELPKAVTGCWASAFTVATLARFAAAGIRPASAPMAVLIQSALKPDFGGTARIDGDDSTVTGVRGSPALLVQGWEPGARATVSHSGSVRGPEAIALMGEATIANIASTLRRARDLTGANACEWAVVDTEVFLLQLLRTAAIRPPETSFVPDLSGEHPVQISRLVRRNPGPLGEALVLPWAVASPDLFLEDVEPAGEIDALEALRSAVEQADELTSQVWDLPKPTARVRARDALRALRGPDPDAPLNTLRGLGRIDQERAHLLLQLVARVRSGLVEAGAVGDTYAAWQVEPKRAFDLLRGIRSPEQYQRIGFDRWEPFNAAVIVSNGTPAHGISAGPGIAAGRMSWITDQASMAAFRPRDVVAARRPLPGLAQLLWDATAVVTEGGSPAAHLFESARALAIPSVCGVRLRDSIGGDPAGSERALAVNGHDGTVYSMKW